MKQARNDGASERPRRPRSRAASQAQDHAAVSLPSMRFDATLANFEQKELPAPSSRQTKSKSRSKSLPQKDTDVPEAADNDPLAPLQEVPFVPTQQLEDYVHAVVWRVGRQFGYQAFNLNPSSAKHKSQQFVASTIFLASDHLVSLIVKNAYVRDKATLNTEDRFAKAVWTVHATIFGSYEDQWCPRVGLPARLRKLDELANGSYNEPSLVHGLLCELSLYFLQYTEGANLRHTPEALWFLFWCANTSAEMEALWGAGPPHAAPHARTRRVAMRNAFQHDITAMQSQFQHNPANATIADCFKALVFMESKVPLPAQDKLLAVINSDPRPLGAPKPSPHHHHASMRDQAHRLAEFTSADMGLYEDLIALGDGGVWCETVLTPIFYVLSFEMDAQFTNGHENSFRLGYDDINESLTRKDTVHNTLKALGVTKEAARSGAVNIAHAAIGALGATEDGGFDPQVAAVFWATKVFNKTMRERRTWAALYRSFYRVFSFHIVLMHLLFIYAFFPNNLLMLSTGVITHGFLHFGERWCNWWISRDQANPLNDKDKAKEQADKTAQKKKKNKDGPMDPESAAASARHAPEDPLAAAARARTVTGALEGEPVVGFFGCWEWGLLVVGLLVFFLCQFVSLAPPMLREMSEAYWLLVAGGYTALMAAHAVLTTRDGYSISLTHALRLPRLFTSSSARPAAGYWLDGNMRIGGRQFWLLVAFWTQTFAIKAVFDYFVIIKPLVEPIGYLLERNWLPCAHPTYTILGTSTNLPCIDGDWLLVVIRVFPFFLVCLMDTHVFYQVTLIIWGVVRGVNVLDIGLVGNWESLLKDFHRAPVRWWEKVISDRGNHARLSLVALKRAQAVVTAHNGGDTDLDISTDSGYASSVSGASSDNDLIGAARNGADAASVARMRLTKLTGGADLLRVRKERVGSWMKRGAAKPPSDLALVLSGQTDEHVAVWDSFAAAWDEIVADLREGDLISNRERDNLRFTRLCYDRGLEVSGVRPILMPAFFFAGQIQKVVDLGMVNEQQSIVLSEARSLLVWLGSHLGLLAPNTVTALLQATFVPEVVDLQHQASRQRMLQACVKMLGAIEAIRTMRADSPGDLRRRQTLHAQVAVALGEVLSALEVECQAVRQVAGGSDSAKGAGSIRNKHGLEATHVVQAETLLAIVSSMKAQLASDPTPVSTALRALHDTQDQAAGGKGGSQWGDSSSSSSAASNMSSACDTSMVMKVVNVLSKMLTLTPAAARPASEEAQRVLGFFMGSLANKQLTKPVPIDEMTSWTILTPCYEEDVLYPMDAGLVAQALNCSKTANLQDGMAGAQGAKAGVKSAAAWGHGGLADLLTETEDRVSLMALLRSVFTTDFENFKERLGDRLGVDISQVSEDAFAPGGPLAELALELQLWASYRGQLLARTVRGMMCYDKALRILARLENPCPPNMPRHTYDEWISQVVASKFSYVVSAQVYGRNRNARDVRSRWLAEGVDVLLEVFEHLKVAFLDSAPSPLTGQNTQYSVLIRGRSAPPAAWEAHDFMASQRVEELYRVRLPYNRYSGRGVILGEGKPENQNHAVIFCTGESLQTIDMNQDNNVAEAFKMRNMLGELAPEVRDEKAYRAPLALGPRASGTDMRKALTKARSAVKPTAIVGFCENIFSDKAGALGSFAASAEFAFGTIVQRTMDTPGNVRMHYGHPDIFNKLHVMTRGGVSKATRQLHISEDIFGGYNHTLRGARVKYREYMNVGKGRDMGFDSINAFEIKISGGAGEVVISRDLWRLSTRMDPFRLMHFYFSGIGYYVNTWIIMLSVAAQIFSLCFLALADANEVKVLTIMPADPLYPTSAPYPAITFQDTLKAQYVLQLGTLSLLPYACELALENGLFKMIIVALQQILSGSFAFFVFKQQTSACYIGTGRGFSMTSSQFLKLWMNYSRTHIYPGVELMSMCFLLLAVSECHSCNFSAMTWGVWLVSASLIFSPFWFNPLVFSTTKVKRDFKSWSAWLRGEVDPDTRVSWHQWQKKQMEKLRNDRNNQPSHGWNVFFNIVYTTFPLLLLTLAAVSRLTVSSTLPVGPLHSSWILFLLATAAIWAVLTITLTTYARFQNRAGKTRSWRLFGFWTAIVCTAVVVAYLTVLTRFYDGSGWNNLVIILYANANLLVVGHRVATQLATKSPRARALVDTGYLVMDTLIGYALLCIIGLLSLTGIVAWLQAILLFNPTFAKSIRRGQLVRTIGLAKTDAAAAQPQIATIESAVSVVSAAAQPPMSVPRSRSASVVAARMHAAAAHNHVDDAVRF